MSATDRTAVLPLPPAGLRVDRIELREVHLPLVEPFRISQGVRQDRRILLLTLHADGIEGWGECVAAEDPSYSYETTGTAWHLLDDFLLPAILRKELDGLDTLLGHGPKVRGHGMAKATVLMAAADLIARAREESLARFLGGTRERIEVGVSVGLQESDDALVEKVAAYVEEGYARIKIKIEPGRDLEMLGEVRARLPRAPLMVDANGAYGPDDLDRLVALDGLDLMMVEQPFPPDDLLSHARLQERMATPVCLDESITSPAELDTALALEACRIVNVKLGRVGGLPSALEIHARARELDLPLWCGGMLESGIGRAHNVALASLPGFTLPGDVSPSRRYWREDLIEPEFEMEEGAIRVPTGPGLGVAPRLDFIEEITARVRVWRG